MALPLTRSAASDTSDGYAHWPPAEATTIGVKKEPAGCTTIGVDADVCGPRVQRATNGGKGGPGVCPRRCVPRACLVVFATLASAIEGAVFGAPSAARAMGAPLLVAAAAGVRVTGLDLLQQRALGAARFRRCPPACPADTICRQAMSWRPPMSTSRRRTGVHSLLFQRELTGRRRSDLLLWSRELMYGSGRSASYIPLPETAKSTIALAFSADGEYFASTHGDHTVKVRPPLPSPGNARAQHRDAPPNPGPHHAPACTSGRGGGRAGGRRRAQAPWRGAACHSPHARLRWPLGLGSGSGFGSPAV